MAVELLEFMYSLSNYFKLIGSDYFRVTKENNSYKFKQYNSSFAKFLFIILSVTFLYVTNLLIVKNNKDSRVGQLLIGFMTGMVGYFYSDIICNRFLYKRSQNLWKSYLKLEEEFKSLGIRVDFRKAEQMRRLFFISYTINVICILIYGSNIWEMGLIQIIQILLILSQYAQTIFIIYFAATYKVAGIYFENLDDFLIEKFRDEKVVDLTPYIRRSAQIHQELCKLWLQANSVVSFRLFYVLVLFYFRTTFELYNMFCIFFRSNCNTLSMSIFETVSTVGVTCFLVKISRSSRIKVQLGNYIPTLTLK